MGTNIHFILQKKGGTGKSLLATTFFQFLLAKGLVVSGIDTDPSNKTFANYKALKITELELLGSEKKVDSRKFDVMVEGICKHPEGSHVVIDSGASCFHDLISYFVESQALEMLQEDGHDIWLHIPIIGGPGTLFSIECFGQLVEIFENIPIIIWKNYFFGEISYGKKSFEEFDIYIKHKNRVEGIIEIPHKNAGTFGKDIQIMQAQGLTYEEVINSVSSSTPMMTRQRVKTFWRETYDAIDKAMVF